MLLSQWASRHGVSDAAIAELVAALTSVQTTRLSGVGTSETAIQSQIRLEASRKGVMLWRNNVGVTWTKDGSYIRYGLANDSQKLNKVLKSSDLIGIRPVKIGPEHVGQTIGQFVAREVKRDGWAYRGGEHEAAQLTYLELVTSYGGDAAFATGVGSL